MFMCHVKKEHVHFFGAIQLQFVRAKNIEHRDCDGDLQFWNFFYMIEH